MGTYIPNALEEKTFELTEITFTEEFKDTHTSLAIQTAMELSLDKLYVVGYDGYSGATIGQKEQEFFMENQFLFDRARQSGLECISLTETKYNKLKQDSIFSYI